MVQGLMGFFEALWGDSGIMGWFRLSRGGSRPGGVIWGLIGFLQA